MADLQALADALIRGDHLKVPELTQQALDEGCPPKDILEQGLISGMNVVGVRFKANEVYVPEVLIAARAMHMGMDILKPELVKAGIETAGLGIQTTHVRHLYPVHASVSDLKGLGPATLAVMRTLLMGGPRARTVGSTSATSAAR